MKELLKKSIIDCIGTWTDPDIYAISLLVSDDGDNPSKPTVTLGYNTKSNVKKEKENASSTSEARWNYAFWLQNEALHFGCGDTANTVKEWVESQGFTYHDDIDYEDDDDDEEITQAFVDLLVEIVQEIHQEKVLKRKFKKELPILIHELEYYDEIADQNVKANGKWLVRGFAKWCRSGS